MTNSIASLQSLFQLSVALNLGFIGYLSLSGDELKKQETLINDLLVIANDIKKKIGAEPKQNKVINDIFADIVSLKNDYRSSSKKIDHISKGWPRYLVLMSAAVSMAMLVYSSASVASVGTLGICFAVALFLPLIGMLVASNSVMRTAARRIAGKRRDIDEQLTDLIEQISERV